MDLVNAGMLGEVDLSPASLFSEFSYPLADLNAHIRGHFPSIGLVETLYLAYALSWLACEE
jgi:hypothetical protein